MLVEEYSKSNISGFPDQRKWRFIGDYNENYGIVLDISVCLWILNYKG